MLLLFSNSPMVLLAQQAWEQRSQQQSQLLEEGQPPQ